MPHFKFTDDELLKVALSEDEVNPITPEEEELGIFKQKFNIVEGSSGVRTGVLYQLYCLYTKTPMLFYKFKKYIKLPLRGHRFMINWGQVNISREENEKITEKVKVFRESKKISKASKAQKKQEVS